MQVVKLIFAIFAIAGAIDKITGNHFKLGDEFEKGILAAGTLALAMVGMICIAPTLAQLLTPVMAPLSKWTGIDPSVLGSFIANDMGGASVARELAASETLGAFNGLVVASMMGVTLCFTIPVALKMIDKAYHKEVLKGILCGIATLPLGCFISGLMLEISLGELLLNLSPVLIVALVTCLGLIAKPTLTCRIFEIIGIIVAALITIGLAAGVFTHITGIRLIPHMLPIMDGFLITSDIAIMLAGIFPLIAVLSKLGQRLFAAAGKRIGINDSAVLGLISSLANSIPTFSLIEKMNEKGRIINMAFAVSAAFIFGDHLAFTLSFNEAYVPAMVVGKLISGLAAVIAACLICSKSNQKEVHK